MTKRKELEQLTDEAVIRRIFPKEVVREIKRVAKEADKPKKKRVKPAASETSA